MKECTGGKGKKEHYTSPGKNWQDLIKIIVRGGFPRNTHGIRRFVHGSHEFIGNSLNDGDVLCKERNEPIDIENVYKVAARIVSKQPKS